MLTDIKLSKSFVFVVVGVLFAWFLGPHILFSADQKRHDRELEDFESQLMERKRDVEESIKSLAILDAGLLRCVEAAALERARIHPRNSGGIDDVSELKKLYCRRMGISSLAGIEKVTSLRFLDISKNQVRDISPLTQSKFLKTLHLEGNPVENIEALAKVQGLESVRLPTLSHMQCSVISRTLGDIKNNLRSTRCQRDVEKPESVDGGSHSLSDIEKFRESQRLSDSEEAEIMNFQHQSSHDRFY